jgi:hypothetical protein
MAYTFEVTQEDIDAAVRADSSHCVIADSIARTVGLKRVHVDLQVITFSDPVKGERVSFLTPEICQDHLIAFDQGEEVHPFSFTLRRPIQIRKMSTGGGSAGPSAAADRAERLTALRAKRDAGEPLTRGEKIALTKMERTGDLDPSKVAYQPKTVETHPKEQPIVRGGKSLPKAVLSNAKGRVRRYGLRQAKPGVAG